MTTELVTASLQTAYLPPALLLRFDEGGAPRICNGFVLIVATFLLIAGWWTWGAVVR